MVLRVVRSHELRQAARRAFVAIDEDDKALEHRSRPQQGPFHFGDYVYYWRRYPRDGSEGRWHGPGVIIGKHGDSRFWVAVGAKVLKCAPELRRTTEEQEAAIRMVTPDLVSKKRGSQGSQVYVDISGEGNPPDGEAAPDETGPEVRKRAREEAGLASEENEMAGYSPSEAADNAAGVMDLDDHEDMRDEDQETAVPDSSASAQALVSRRTSAGDFLQPE